MNGESFNGIEAVNCVLLKPFFHRVKDTAFICLRVHRGVESCRINIR